MTIIFYLLYLHFEKTGYSQIYTKIFRGNPFEETGDSEAKIKPENSGSN